MSAPTAPSARYAWLVVALLMLAYLLSFVDRQILSLLVGPIRKDLGIDDTQMSLLMGFSFALFYTVCGIPLARWADTRSRRALIVAGVMAWSLATALCGLAQRYAHMLLARVGVGVGEAALSPAAYSLITDYFPRDQRATAISVYSMGIYLGSGLAFLLGGLVIQFAASTGPVALPAVGEVRPWQLVFLILGGLGVLFGLALLLIREPPRTGTPAGAPAPQVKASLVRNARTLLCHNLGFALFGLASYGSSAWVPTWFMRVHQWSPAQTALVYGGLVTVFGTAGILFGGRLADRWLHRGHHDATLRVAQLAALAAIPCTAAFLLVPDARFAGLLLAPTVFCFSMPFGVGPAGLQEIVPAPLRAQVSALYLFVVNLLGLGLGPTAVALVTDYGFGDDLAIGRSLLIVCGAALAASALLLWLGRRPFRESYARQRADEARGLA